MNGQSIGIDLGTYNSCAAYAASEHQVLTIKSHHGSTLQGLVFPSFLRFDALGNVKAYGEEARKDMASTPDLVVWGVKRLIGRSFRQVEKELRRFAYPVEQGPDGGVVISIGSHRYTPVDISSLILHWIKEDAENGKLNPFITGRIGKAVITHPAYFDTQQTEQTQEAAMHAGFDEIELIAEPVAAALAYGLQLDATRPQFIMAIDWGAGTLDIAIVALTLDYRGYPFLAEVRPARGDVALGGIDMDDLLLARAVEVYALGELQPLVGKASERLSSEEADIFALLEMALPPEMASLLRQLQGVGHPDYQRPAASGELWADLCKLRDTTEKLKIELSRVPAAREFTTYRGRPVQIKMTRTRNDRLDNEADWIILEEVLQPLLEIFRGQVAFALQESGLRPEDIQHVLLIGGPMHMPCVRRVVKEAFASNRQVVQELNAIEAQGFPVNPMEAVAKGAALYARNLGPGLGSRLINRDYGVLLGMQGEILIHEGDVLPCEASLGEGRFLGCTGKPGDRVPVGLYKREGEHYYATGRYEFVPKFNEEGKSQFRPVLKADRDGIVSMKILDLLSGGTLNLDRISVLEGERIPKPFPFSLTPPPPPPPPIPGDKVAPRPEPFVPEDLVSQTRKVIESTLLPIARAKRDHPRVQAERKLQGELVQRIGAVEEALRKLPSRGNVKQEIFQNVAHRATELRVFLDTYQLLTEEERMLLFG